MEALFGGDSSEESGADESKDGACPVGKDPVPRGEGKPAPMGNVAGVSGVAAVAPDLSHLSYRDFKHLYEPSEDTYMFIDGLAIDAAALRSMLPTVCVELGTGSGCVLTALAGTLGPAWPALYIGTDINMHAAEAARGTVTRNGVCHADVVRTDLLRGVGERLHGHVDVLLFNPPYVPTPSVEVGSRGIAAAWAGGDRGREVIDRVLPLVPVWLSPRGVFYMVTVEDNDLPDIQRIMKRLGFRTQLVTSRLARNERLHLLRFERHSGLPADTADDTATATSIADVAGIADRGAAADDATTTRQTRAEH